MHSVNASYNLMGASAQGALPLAGATALTDSVLSGHPESKVGGSVMVALQIKNIPTGQGDDIKMDASWAKGDTKNVIATSGSSPSFAMLGGVPGQFGSNRSIGFGSTTDAVFLPIANRGDGSLHLTEAFGFRGAFNHNWDPYWSSSLFGGIGFVRYDGAARAEYCAAYGVTVPGQGVTYTCNPNFDVSQIGVITRWTPVTNLTFSAEAMWTHLRQNFSGFATFTPGAPQPIQTWTYKNQDTVSLNVRVQRNF